jgi:membrane-bound lytic murein transglycosylase B
MQLPLSRLATLLALLVCCWSAPAGAQIVVTRAVDENGSIVLSNIGSALDAEQGKPWSGTDRPGDAARWADQVDPPAQRPTGRMRPQDAQPVNLHRLIADVAREHGVGPELIAAVAAAESRFDARAQSPRGAQGIMQLMPATARRFGVQDVWSVEDNLRGGAAYLRWLTDFFRGDVTLAVAAYNAGENAVLRAGRRIPPYEETRRYVPKVLAWRAHYAREFAAADRNPTQGDTAGPDGTASPLRKTAAR